jgi:hypothetical protein
VAEFFVFTQSFLLKMKPENISMHPFFTNLMANGCFFSLHGNAEAYSGATTYIPTYGVTGFTTHVATKTTYTRFLFLDAYGLAIYVKESKMTQVSTANAISTDSSNDLRLIVPDMITAMKPYLGINTGHKVKVMIRINDPTVELLRSNQAPVAK